MGLTGLIGSGYDEVIYMAYGAVPAAGGVLELGSRSIDLAALRPREAVAAGCILIPSDRPGAGAVPTLNVTENVNLAVLGDVSRPWALADAKLADNAAALAERFDIRPRDPALLFGALSGGNQQKALIAKWFQTSTQPDAARRADARSRRRRSRSGILGHRQSGGGRGDCALRKF